MTLEHSTPIGAASQLQEAVDTIVQLFDHPAEASVEYTSESGEKRTTIEVTTSDETIHYELVYDGRREDAEPELVRLE